MAKRNELDRINNSKVHPREVVIEMRTWKAHKVKNIMDDGNNGDNEESKGSTVILNYPFHAT